MRTVLTIAIVVCLSSCYKAKVQPPDENAYAPPVDTTASEADDSKAVNDLFLPTSAGQVANSNPVSNEESSSTPIEQVQSTHKTFSLTQAELYPTERDRANQDYQSYTQPISGVIKAADFYEGYMEVAGDDGEYYMLRIQPEDLPTSLKSDVHYYMKTGNRIKCICTLAGARELIIVSVTFTDLQT